MSELPPELQSPKRDAVSFSGASGRFAANTLFNFVGRFSALLATLLITPYLLARLGVDTFGVWVLLSVFANAFALLDVGLGWSFIKYVSEYNARGEFGRISSVLFVGAAFYVVLGAVFVCVGTVAGPALLALFRVDADPGVLVVLLAAFGVGNIATLMLSMLRGLQRMDQSNAVEVLASVLRIVGTVVVIEWGTGIAGLAVNALFVAVLGSIFGWMRLRHVAPWISFRWAPDLPLLGQLLGYGAKLQVVRLSELVCFQVDRLIISRFLGVAPVSFYEVGSRLALFMRALPYVMISVLTPAVSELEAVRDRRRVQKLYRLASKYVIVTTVGLVSLVLIEANELLALWLGPGFEASAVIVRVLAVGYGLNAISAVAGQTGSGFGRPDFEMRGAILLSILNPILSISLIQILGIRGVAIGTSVALGIGAGYVVHLFHRSYDGDSAISVVRQACARPLMAAVCGAAVVWVVMNLFPNLGADMGVRATALVRFGIGAPTFIAAYAASLLVSGHLTAEDLENLRRLSRVPLTMIRPGLGGHAVRDSGGGV